MKLKLQPKENEVLLQVRIPESIDTRLMAICAEHKIPKARLVRFILTDAIDDIEQNSGKKKAKKVK